MIELLVSISIVGILIAIIVPCAASMQRSAKSASCLSRLRVIGSSILLYAADHDQSLPSNGSVTGRYYVLIGPYIDAKNQIAADLRDLRLFRCPVMDTKPDVLSTSKYMYTYNVLIGFNDGNDNINNDTPVSLRMTQIARPNFTPMLWDCAGDTGSGSNRFLPTARALDYGYKGSTSAAGLSPNHGPNCNILFVSGRVAAADFSSINNFPWNGASPPSSGKNTAFDPFYEGR